MSLGMTAIAAIIGFIVLAKHGGKPKRKYRAYIRGQVEEQLPLGTLAAGTLVSALFDEVVDEQCWISSVKATWAIQRMTK